MRELFHRSIGLVVVVVTCCVLAACSEPERIYSFEGHTMGTTWSVKTVGLPPGVTRTELRSDIHLLLESLLNQMSLWRRDSVISQYNKAPAGTWVPLPADFFRVLDYALKLARKTGGAFDPTVGPLVSLWGFGPGRYQHDFNRPSKAAIEQALARTGWKKVELSRQRQAVLQPGAVSLNLASVAEGYAVDKIVRFLHARGVDAFFVSIGGEVRAHGRKPDGSVWRVGVEKPLRDPGRRIAVVLALRNRAISTSGGYRNFHRGKHGTYYSHIIDPRTGYPVDHRLASVTVVAADCMKADGLSTALMVMGPDKGMAYARRHDLAVLMFIRSPEGLRRKATDSFRRLVQASRRQTAVPN